MLKASSEEPEVVAEKGVMINGVEYECPICKGRNTHLRAELDCTIHRLYEIASAQCDDILTPPIVYRERFYCAMCDNELTPEEINEL